MMRGCASASPLHTLPPVRTACVSSAERLQSCPLPAQRCASRHGSSLAFPVIGGRGAHSDGRRPRLDKYTSSSHFPCLRAGTPSGSWSVECVVDRVLTRPSSISKPCTLLHHGPTCVEMSFVFNSLHWHKEFAPNFSEPCGIRKLLITRFLQNHQNQQKEESVYVFVHGR